MSNLENTIDLLDDLIYKGKTSPFNNSIKIDRDEIQEIAISLRASLPGEIKDAKKVISDCEGYIAEAKREAASIVKQAEFEADKMVSEHEIYKKAIKEAEEMKFKAEEDTLNGILEVKRYIDELLEEADAVVTKVYQLTEEQQQITKNNYTKSAEIIKELREELRK